MKPASNRIASLVAASGLVSEHALAEAMSRQAQWGGRLGRILLDMGLIGEDALASLLEQGLRVPRVRLKGLAPDMRALARVDPTHALQRALFPVDVRDGGRTLFLAMADPTDLEAADHVAQRAGMRVQVAVAGERELELAQRRLWPHAGTTGNDAFGQVAGVGREEDEEPDEITGFKVMDASGRTVVRHIDALMELDAPPPPPVARGEVGGSLPELEASRAAALLDDLLKGGPTPIPEGFTSEQRQRIEALRANQEKSSRILRALLELAVEKGLFQTPELARRMRG